MTKKRYTWGKIAALSGISFALTIGLAFLMPWLLRKSAGYAWWAYGSAFIWVAVAGGAVALISMWIWVVGQLRHHVRAAWSRIANPDAEPMLRKRVRRGSAIAWLTIPLIGALAVAAAPDVREHGGRNGVAQRPTNFATEDRIERYEYMADNPNSYPWEERNALWVDQVGCLKEVNSFFMSHSLESIRENTRFAIETQEYIEYHSTLGDDRVITGMEQIVKTGTDELFAVGDSIEQVAQQYEVLYEEIVEGTCGVDQMNDDERERWRSDAVETFPQLYEAVLSES